MAGLARTLSDLARHRRDFARLMKLTGRRPARAEAPGHPPSRLFEVADFGPNPGNLRMFAYVPPALRPRPALVVVLHGCTQTAAGYDHGAGWSALADEYGFALVLPEQQRANNPQGCFNWFEAGDTRRDGGEARSIRAMVERMAIDHGVDRARIFVTGLSAGGAMAGAMLAAYPEVFAGGAIVAGLPYGTATKASEAFESMFKGRDRSAAEWGDLVRGASGHSGPWPKVSVWHGSADATVVPANAAETVKQWTNVHGLPAAAAVESRGPGFTRQVWRDKAGREVVESFTIAGMAHGAPLAAGVGEGRYGNAGPFLLDVGVSSTFHIARFWGLLDEPATAGEDVARAEEAAIAPKPPAKALAANGAAAADREAAPDREDHEDHEDEPRGLTGEIHAVIAKALRAAGLMRP
ncbi:MAG TPA: PHB depolymerase family esterase [Beijerinckiaceae bacterium]